MSIEVRIGSYECNSHKFAILYSLQKQYFPHFFQMTEFMWKERGGFPPLIGSWRCRVVDNVEYTTALGNVSG